MTKTDNAFYDGHRNWYIAGFLTAVVLLGWSALVAHHWTISGWDLRIFRHINNWPDSWRTTFKALSVVRSSLWLGVIAVVGACLFRFWRLAWRLAVAIIASYAVGFLLKHYIAKPRPFLQLGAVHQRWTDSGTSFPSGHVMLATVVMLCILPYLPKWLKWLVPVVILAVALSRIYLGLHTPIDVIGGFAVGLGVVSFIRILPQSIKVALRLD